MNHSLFFIPHKFFAFLTNSKLKFSIILISLIFFGCSSTKRFLSDSNADVHSSNLIGVLLANTSGELTILVNDEIFISDDKKSLAKVASGNKLKFNNYSGKLKLTISSKEFVSDIIFLNPSDENEILKIDDKKYRGRIKVFIRDSEIKVVNQLGLEEYVKGVMTKEMPVGNGNENYGALKAFSICVRTYALNKLNEKKDFFDIYRDTRDQVYAGVDDETEYTNSIVDETFGEVLTFDNQSAKVFYHSTCGGRTEDVENVFGNVAIPYLKSIEDGNEHFCKISPRYEWTEKYSESVFMDRLYKAKLIESNKYQLSDVKIKSRFDSGRVNELDIIVNNGVEIQKTIFLVGNQIRSIIRSGDDKSILKSTLCNIDLDDENNIVITGKGNGHGVGLCQWGAIGQSKKGIDYKNILKHYFPGTNIKSLYD